jgi:hypothetical protein
VDAVGNAQGNDAMSPETGTVSLRCTSCGGWLDQTKDPGLLDCAHCGLGHLQLVGESIGIYEPVGRLGRRRASRRLHAGLRERGVKGASLEAAQLLHVPFWQIEGKLVGWQRFGRPVETKVRRDLDGIELPLKEIEIEERSISQPLLSSIAACDSRQLGLLGIAHRAQQMRMRPFTPDETGEDAVAVVLRGAASARRQARDTHIAKLCPRNARGLVQRFALLRCTSRLLYYPIWKFRYVSAGRHHGAVMDGMSGELLEGSYPHVLRRTDQGWFVAATASAFLAGLAGVLGLFFLGGWMFHRLRRSPNASSVADLAGWLSSELTPSREETRPFGPRTEGHT